VSGYITGAADSKTASKPLHQGEMSMAYCTKQMRFSLSYSLTSLRFQGQEIKALGLGRSSGTPWPDWQCTWSGKR